MQHNRIKSAGGILALAILLSGCSSSWTENNSSRPSKGFLFNEGDTLLFGGNQRFNDQRPVTAADLVGPDGACALPDSAADASAQASDAPADPNAPSTQPNILRGGIALQMTECEVVYRAGPVEKIDIGANERNERAVVLTYLRGPWPGIYRFSDGRLSQVDRVAVPEAPKAKKKAPSKKKKA